MNYTGSSFNSSWDSPVLEVECFKVEEDSFQLLGIILNAADKQGGFRLAWDLRKMETPSIFDLYKIVRFCAEWKSKLDKKVEKTSILTSHGTDKYLSYVLTIVPPGCPYYLGSSYHEWQRFLH